MERGVPAYVLFHDTTLIDLARLRPTRPATLQSVMGMGERKRADFGDTLMALIRAYCQEHDLDADTSAPKPQQTLSEARSQAFALFAKGQHPTLVAATIQRAPSTTWQYLSEYIAHTKPVKVDAWVDDRTYQTVLAAAEAVTEPGLKTVFDHLQGQVPYESIRVVLAHRRYVGMAE